ncbi:MAG: hypothetical protein HC848_09335, partial [Limnobacter sp.]|nr:hypothetical protein [Limnobacter sp.]
MNTNKHELVAKRLGAQPKAIEFSLFNLVAWVCLLALPLTYALFKLLHWVPATAVLAFATLSCLLTLLVVPVRTRGWRSGSVR